MQRHTETGTCLSVPLCWACGGLGPAFVKRYDSSGLDMECWGPSLA